MEDQKSSFEHLVMVSEKAVWNGYSSGTHDGVDQSICATWQWTVVNPNCAWSKDGNPISITLGSKPIMCGGAPNICISRRFTVVDMNSMNDNIGHILNCNASSICYMNIGTSTINSLITVHDKLLLELNNHIFLENNPERFGLNNSVPQSARSRIDRVIVIWICNYIKSAILTSNGVFAKSDGTISQSLSVVNPVRITTPTVIDGVPRFARAQLSFRII